MRFNSVSFFISAFTKNNIFSDNMVNHWKLRDDIRALQLDFTDCMGCYMGNKEFSFVVSGSISNEQDIKSLANKYQQECYMIVYGIDQATEVVYYDDTRKYIGKMTNVGDVRPEGDYSYINETYYQVR
jgi:hypothetical protein